MASFRRVGRFFFMEPSSSESPSTSVPPGEVAPGGAIVSAPGGGSSLVSSLDLGGFALFVGGVALFAVPVGIAGGMFVTASAEDYEVRQSAAALSAQVLQQASVAVQEPYSVLASSVETPAGEWGASLPDSVTSFVLRTEGNVATLTVDTGAGSCEVDFLASGVGTAPAATRCQP